jgi:hypothetical protein
MGVVRMEVGWWFGGVKKKRGRLELLPEHALDE